MRGQVAPYFDQEEVVGLGKRRHRVQVVERAKDVGHEDAFGVLRH